LLTPARAGNGVSLQVEDQVHLDVTDARLRQCLARWAVSHGFECTPVDGTYLCVHGWRIPARNGGRAPSGLLPVESYPVAAIVRHDASRQIVHCRLVADVPSAARRPNDSAVLRGQLEELLSYLCPESGSESAA
jgi:hypothetical protein